MQRTINELKTIKGLATLIQTNTASENIDFHESLVLIDLDLTIFDRKPPLSDLYPRERREFLESLNPLQQENAYAQSPYHLIEEEILAELKQLGDQGFIVLGFTSRRTGKFDSTAQTTVQEDACKSLNELGVQFSQIEDVRFEIPENSVQLENPHLLPYAELHSPQIFGCEFNTSTIFTANYPKWLIIDFVMNHLSSIGKPIKQIIQIDDNRAYLEALQNKLMENDLKYHGFHYLFAHQHKPLWNAEIVELQQAYLKEHLILLDEKEVLNFPEEYFTSSDDDHASDVPTENSSVSNDMQISPELSQNKSTLFGSVNTALREDTVQNEDSFKPI